MKSNFTVENAHPEKYQKKRRKLANKAKIPQNLIENRKQEIISSLEKIEDSNKVIEGIPRVYTGSKRGSNYRGVSVNGKKWQVNILFLTSHIQLNH